MADKKRLIDANKIKYTEYRGGGGREYPENVVTEDEIAKVKVGFIFLHDENSTYDLNFINAAKEACETLGVEYEVKVNIPESEACYDAAAELVDAGCTYMELTGGIRNYCIFTPKQSGVYKVSLHNAEGEVGYYGGTFFVLDSNSGTVVDGGIELTVSNGQIGTDGDGGTTKMVIGIDVAEGVTDCVLSIIRIGDYKPSPQESEWVNYFSAYNPVKYTLPEGLTIQEFDLTSSYTLVLNAADGFYHLNTADGPIVLVRMNAELSYGGCFGAILSNTNVGVYEYDEEGNFTQRVSFNSVLHKYLGDLSTSMGSYKYENTKLDDAYGVYPLNEDLMYIIQTYGTYKGWWDRESDNYLFATLPGVNAETAWLFMCCYAQ